MCSRPIITYSCGHVEVGASWACASAKTSSPCPGVVDKPEYKSMPCYTCQANGQSFDDPQKVDEEPRQRL
ncbi:hypothetical protein CI238_01702 [Colletotrichum incanum]|uniref:Uncharacterized protein n=1 Tax=Colletotrichum incanum TaxID=1573173 RepID=A0A162PHN3_COLIC|nr:hypothetical protein CI238_01702 [Colletotrichum incanum]